MLLRGVKMLEDVLVPYSRETFIDLRTVSNLSALFEAHIPLLEDPLVVLQSGCVQNACHSFLRFLYVLDFLQLREHPQVWTVGRVGDSFHAVKVVPS